MPWVWVDERTHEHHGPCLNNRWFFGHIGCKHRCEACGELYQYYDD